MLGEGDDTLCFAQTLLQIKPIPAQLYMRSYMQSKKRMYKGPLHALKAHVEVLSSTCALSACRDSSEGQHIKTFIRDPPQSS